MFTDFINMVVKEYVKKRMEYLKKENEELKRELRKRNSVDVEYVVVEDSKKD